MKNWSGKATVRLKTVIEAYRRLTGRYMISQERQYWTLCGRYETLDDGSEIVQVVSSGLIKPEQFFAAEVERDAYKVSALTIGARYPTATVINADLVSAMTDFKRRDKLAPEIVYVDTMHEPDAAFKLVSRVLDLINYTSGYTMVLCNLIRENPHDGRAYTEDEISEIAQNNKALGYHMKEGRWDYIKDLAPYRWSYTKMGTITLMRKGVAL